MVIRRLAYCPDAIPDRYTRLSPGLRCAMMIASRTFDDGEMLRLYRNFEELGFNPSLTIPGAPHCGFKVIVPGDKHADWSATVANALKIVWPDQEIESVTVDKTVTRYKIGGCALDMMLEEDTSSAHLPRNNRRIVTSVWFSPYSQT
jgi:hypothetical protein